MSKRANDAINSIGGTVYRLLLFVLIILMALVFPTAAQDTIDTATAPTPTSDSAYHRFVLDSLKLEHQADLDRLESSRMRSIPATEVIGVSIPIIVIIIVFLYLWRLAESKKAVRIAMIERGMDPSVLDLPANESSRKYGALRVGMLLAGFGAGLLAGFAINEIFGLWHYEFSPLIVISSALLFGGGGLIAYHRMVNAMEDKAGS